MKQGLWRLHLYRSPDMPALQVIKEVKGLSALSMLPCSECLVRSRCCFLLFPPLRPFVPALGLLAVVSRRKASAIFSHSRVSTNTSRIRFRCRQRDFEFQSKAGGRDFNATSKWHPSQSNEPLITLFDVSFCFYG